MQIKSLDTLLTDLQKVQAALTKDTFQKKRLTVNSVPVSCTVLVSNLPHNPPVSEDMLINYFENRRRSGGEEGTEVELDSNANYALITFANAQGQFLHLHIHL